MPGFLSIKFKALKCAGPKNFLDKEGKAFFEIVYSTQKKRIFNALKSSNSDSVIKFKDVLKKIINGK